MLVRGRFSHSFIPFLFFSSGIISKLAESPSPAQPEDVFVESESMDAPRQNTFAGNLGESYQAELQALQTDKLLSRLWSQDVYLWALVRLF